jgi:hypothetical protein
MALTWDNTGETLTLTPSPVFDTVTIGQSVDASGVNTGKAFLPNFYANTNNALRLAGERLQHGSRIHSLTASTATNADNATGWDYDNFATITNGQTIEFDFTGISSNGYTYLGAIDLILVTMRSTGAVLPSSIFVEYRNSSNVWVAIGTMTTPVYSSGSGALYVLQNPIGQQTFIRGMRFTFTGTGTMLCVATEWHPSRASASDPAEYIRTSSPSRLNVYAPSIWLRGQSSFPRIEIDRDGGFIRVNAGGGTPGISTLGGGFLEANATTPSTSTTTGAIRTAGGIGSQGAVYAGGEVQGTEFRIGGTKVLGARQTGFTLGSGTEAKGAIDDTTITLQELAQQVIALKAALAAHGIIGS